MNKASLVDLINTFLSCVSRGDYDQAMNIKSREGLELQEIVGALLDYKITPTGVISRNDDAEINIAIDHITGNPISPEILSFSFEMLDQDGEPSDVFINGHFHVARNNNNLEISDIRMQ